MVVSKKKELSLPKLTAKAQQVFNAWIRRRDVDAGCISCPSYKVEHASHYLSVGHHGQMRFNEMNVNGSCSKCNTFLHGNLIGYRQGLVKRYGENKVLMLEAQAHKVKKWSKTELIAIIETYKLTK